MLDEFELNPDIAGRELVAEVDHAAKLVHSLRIEKVVGVRVTLRVAPADQVFARAFEVVELLEFGTRSDVRDDELYEIVCQLHCQRHAHLGDLALVEYVLSKVRFLCIRDMGPKEKFFLSSLLNQLVLTDLTPS